MYNSVNIGLNPARKQRKSMLGTRRRSIQPNNITFSGPASVSKQSAIRRFRKASKTPNIQNTVSGIENNHSWQSMSETPHNFTMASKPVVKKIFQSPDEKYATETEKYVLTDSTNTFITKKLDVKDEKCSLFYTTKDGFLLEPPIPKTDLSKNLPPGNSIFKNWLVTDKTTWTKSNLENSLVVDKTTWSNPNLKVSVVDKTDCTKPNVEDSLVTDRTIWTNSVLENSLVTDRTTWTDSMLENSLVTDRTTYANSILENSNNSFEENETLLMQNDRSMISLDNTLIDLQCNENDLAENFTKLLLTNKKKITALDSIEEEPENKPIVETGQSGGHDVDTLDSKKVIDSDNSDTNTEILVIVNKVLNRQTEIENMIKQNRDDLNAVKEYLSNVASKSETNKLTSLNDSIVPKTNNRRVKSMLDDLRSDISFLKTPRLTNSKKRSTILTPHSMSFCIQNQFEKLLE